MLCGFLLLFCTNKFLPLWLPECKVLRWSEISPQDVRSAIWISRSITIDQSVYFTANLNLISGIPVCFSTVAHQMATLNNLSLEPWHLYKLSLQIMFVLTWSHKFVNKTNHNQCTLGASLKIKLVVTEFLLTISMQYQAERW